MSAFGMRHKDIILGLAERFDELLLSRAQGGDGPAEAASVGEVAIILIHRLFTKEDLRAKGRFYPHEEITVEQFEEVIKAFLAWGYRFLDCQAITNNQHLGSRSVLLTFDDGYHDNLRALPVLERYGVPATFFIAPAAILRGERFWPDVVYIEGTARGWSRKRMASLARHLKKMQPEQVRWTLRELFGPRALAASSDFDRPLTRSEVKTLAACPLVEIGNHSWSHVTLAPRSPAFVEQELERSQTFIDQHLGRRPVCIAYPNGVYSERLLDTVGQCGFRIGMGTKHRINRLGPYEARHPFLALNRFTLSGRRHIGRQLSSMRLAISASQCLGALKSNRVND